MNILKYKMFQTKEGEIEKILIKKKNYISIRSMESMIDNSMGVIDFLNQFIQNSKDNGDIETSFTQELQDRIKRDSQTKLEYTKFKKLLEYRINPTVVGDTFHQEGCNYRVDIKFPSSMEIIGDKYYRIFLTSCDEVLKIDNISYISDIDNTNLSNKLVCIMVMNKMCIGTIVLESESIKYQMKISGSLSKLDKYKNMTLGLHVHTQGDISDDCKKCGVHYNPTLQFHGDVSGERHLGDLGNIEIDSNGNSEFIIYFTSFPSVNDILINNFLGRSIVLHDSQDDLGKEKNTNSVKTGNSGNRIACGVIGGIYENS
jgi:Cu-Zn family superoxide dismutase